MSFQEKLARLRKEKGMSQEDLAFEIGVSRQSVSKWETGDAEPTVNTLKALAQTFGVSIDFLLNEEELTTSAEQPSRIVTACEATEFLSIAQKNAFWLAFATLLCILSPIALIILGAISEYPSFGITEGMAAGIGMTVLLLFVACATSIFIVCNANNDPYSYLEKDSFLLENDIKASIQSKWGNYRKLYTRNNAFATCLCILSLLPLFIGIMIDESNDILLVSMLCSMFLIVGIGVFIFIRTGTIWASFEKLLQVRKYSKNKK